MGAVLGCLVGPRTARSGRSAEMHIQAPAGAFLHAAKKES